MCFLVLATWSVLKLNIDLTYVEIWTGNFCYRTVTFLSSRSVGGHDKCSGKLHTLYETILILKNSVTFITLVGVISVQHRAPFKMNRKLSYFWIDLKTFQ